MADSEVRQKFEAPSETPDAFEQAWKEFNSGGVASGWEMVAFTSGFGKGFAAGMRAGEIAMREKALQAIVEDMPCDCGFSEQPTHYKYNTESGHAMNCNQYATLEAIRALPAAPEEKK